MEDPEARAERRREEPRPGRRADQGEPRQVEPQRARRRALAEDDVQLEVLHRRVEDLLDRPVQPVDLVDEEDVVLGQGPSARTLRLDLPRFTLIGATTRTGLLTTPLRARFGVLHRLNYYDASELAAIVRRSARLLDVDIDDDGAATLAERSRGTPRIANRLLRRVRDVAQVRGVPGVDRAIAEEALELLEVDALGLEELDRQILRRLAETFEGRPVGLGTLADSVGEAADTHIAARDGHEALGFRPEEADAALAGAPAGLDAEGLVRHGLAALRRK